MNIITILGSPRMKGNTAKVLSMFEDKISQRHNFERINITKYKINGCIGCYKCKESNFSISQGNKTKVCQIQLQLNRQIESFVDDEITKIRNFIQTG